MRAFEILLCVINLAGMILLLRHDLQRHHWVVWICVAIIAVIVQSVFEGARWQMVPAYTFPPMLLLTTVSRNSVFSRLSPFDTTGLIWRLFRVSCVVVVYIITVIPPALIPIFKFPVPDGMYGIGTTSFHWIDSTRHEIFSEEPAQERELMVQIWYPTAKLQNGVHDNYVADAGSLSKGLASALSSNGLITVPSFFFDHFKYVRSNAMIDVPISASGVKFPVLIYLSGLDGFRQTGMFQVEYLVSHGYVVVGIDQPYASASVTFPDGSTVQGLTKSEMQPLIDQSIAPVPEPPAFNGILFPRGVVTYFSEDVSFILDKLFDSSNIHPDPGSIDTTRIGVFGVSLGAMVATEASRFDPRIKACLGMDAAIPSDVVAHGLKQPLMFITRPGSDMRLERSASGGWTERDIEQTLSTQMKVYRNALPGRGYFVSIAGMFHINFTDAPRYSPLMSTLGLVGPIDSEKGFKIVNTYTGAFFDHTLKGLPSPLLKGNAVDPGVIYLHH